MMDVMTSVTVLLQFLQTENVNVTLIRVKLDFAIKGLEKSKEMIPPNLTTLARDIWDMYKSGHIRPHSVCNVYLDK